MVEILDSRMDLLLLKVLQFSIGREPWVVSNQRSPIRVYSARPSSKPPESDELNDGKRWYDCFLVFTVRKSANGELAKRIQMNFILVKITFNYFWIREFH